jgi:hypothetical protein
MILSSKESSLDVWQLPAISAVHRHGIMVMSYFTGYGSQGFNAHCACRVDCCRVHILQAVAHCLADYPLLLLVALWHLLTVQPLLWLSFSQ